MFIKEGIIASPGISIARALVYEKVDVQVSPDRHEDSCQEIEKFHQALDESQKQLEEIQLKTADELGEEAAAIFEAHGMILRDPEFMESVEKEIGDSKVSAAYAVQMVTERLVMMFEQMNDPYFSARAADVKDVGNRVRNNILGIVMADLSKLQEDVIIIADDLAPSDTALMDKTRVSGFATNVGSRTSHTAIMARSLEIPAVLGLTDIVQNVKTGDMIVVDGLSGRVIVNPDRYQIKAAEADQRGYQAYLKELECLKDLEAVTLDGHQVELVGNIGEPGDVQGVLKNGGTGIGLYRTEFLYMNSDAMPGEDKQMAAYRSVLEAFPDGPVIIRTMDIGGDKNLPYLPLDDEMNPFLGLRAIRLCFKESELFKTQLRAILRAGVYGNAYIMFPMISNVDEVRQGKKILAECMAELDALQVPYRKDVKVGVMIEIPSAAITADIIAKEVDFFSIGTNDLCQYTIAVDRMNQDVSYLYDPFNPAILRLVKQVIQASDDHPGLFTGMCGEMAGDPMAVVILLGLGLQEFSMSALSIPQVKKIIRSVRYQDAKKIADQALKLETGVAVRVHMLESMKRLKIEI
ncbi:phosphoenolpyruvate--protein phosphotransferase [Acetobacterium wieringae]|uniref:Phosphoenolpyruvate-protein phosphotransferase n=1 Tax=Acetobacterium wieringae TaxID=52694 RepID=A0ABY6HGC8_9FIRM|nr:phosphoenolpyruvate--protein phosphotransferase [Acetobacterium wieringae]UYO63452.1 phosphoenolpyruvate--protein phosphotransferase [Acetobacterium wieringae]VUZ27162.1 Phosphoenolpyruvate-protein phosphotransferase [Acetobacterium wieringae]